MEERQIEKNIRKDLELKQKTLMPVEKNISMLRQTLL